MNRRTGNFGGSRFQRMREAQRQRDAEPPSVVSDPEPVEIDLEDENVIRERQIMIERGRNFFKPIQDEIFSTVEDLKVTSVVEERASFDMIEKTLQKSFSHSRSCEEFESLEYVLHFDLDESFIQEIFTLNDNVNDGTIEHVRKMEDIESLYLNSFDVDDDSSYDAILNINRNFKQLNYERGLSEFHRMIQRDMHDGKEAASRIETFPFHRFLFETPGDPRFQFNETANKLKNQLRLIETSIKYYEAVSNDPKYKDVKVAYMPNYNKVEDLYYKHQHTIFDFNQLLKIETETIDVYHYYKYYYYGDDKFERIKRYYHYLFFKYFDVFKQRVLILDQLYYVPISKASEVVIYLEYNDIDPFAINVNSKKKLVCTDINVSDVVLAWADGVLRNSIHMSSLYNQGYG